MKSMVKKIFLTVAAVICCGTVLVGGAWCSAQRDESLCTEVRVVVEDSLQRQFVDTDELVRYLQSKKHYPLKQTMQQIDCHAIEQCLLKHDMVRNVECYKSPFGKVHIVVSQRIPILQVVTNDGLYYVDSDRRIMPVRTPNAIAVPIFKGAINQRAATEEYYDFVTWLSTNRYWNERIQSIHISTPKHLVIHQKGEGARIILGELDGYAEKLDKLQKLYTKGFDKIGYPTHREYDLRFNGQVVGRK